VVDVARTFLRYDVNDRFKISVGRYHAPVTYWATAFHRGMWLQTTVFRPDYIKDEWFQPEHFNGVVAEGLLVSRAGLGYMVGVGNGRKLDLRKQGNPADFADLEGDTSNVGHHQAQVVRVSLRSPQFSGVEFGGSFYHDVIAQNGTPGVPEWIGSVTHANSPVDQLSFADLRQVLKGERQYWTRDLAVVLFVRAPTSAERSAVLDVGSGAKTKKPELVSNGASADAGRAGG
jgi:hypothetical protein